MAFDELFDDDRLSDREQWRRWWRRYGLAIAVGLVVGLICIMSWQWWQYRQQQQQLQRQGTYSALTQAITARSWDLAVTQWRSLDPKNPSIYGTLASLVLANALQQAGRRPQAIVTLQTVVADPVLAPIVRQRLARLLIAEHRADQAIQVLHQDLDPSGQVLLGDAQRALGRLAQARQAYQNALQKLAVTDQQRPIVEMKLMDAGGGLSAPHSSFTAEPKG